MDLKGKTIAVTGASGMLGVYLCRSLLAAGANVRGVVRNPAKAGFLASEGVAFGKADLNDRAALTEAFRGADAVISNAALWSFKNMKWEDNYRANKEGTENVYHAVAAAGVKRVVHISTYGVYKFKPFHKITETDAVLDGAKKQGGAYRATKQMSERLARELSEKAGVGLTVFRPTGIYGARDTNLIQPLRMLMRWPVLPFPTAVFPLVFAGDIGDAAVGALRNDAAAGKTYNVGGDNRPLIEFARAWKEVAGKGPLIVPLPAPLKFLIDNGRAEAEIGFRNRPFVDGFRAIAAEEPLL